MESSSLPALYNAASIIVWVEDLVTSVYLQALWRQDSRFHFYVGGGHETLLAVVEDARRAGFSHVFGLRDRDFGSTNRHRWKQPDVTCFALETFEIECFLLDPSALASSVINTAGRPEQWIDEHLRAQATSLLWWMACRKVLGDLREARQTMFPSHPKRGQVSSRAQAERILLDNDWVKLTVPGLPEKVQDERLREALLDAHARYAAMIEQGTWRSAFSGKELLEELVAHVFNKQRPKGNAALQDLAKAVAHEQLASGREPRELMELRDVLLERLASPSPPS